MAARHVSRLVPWLMLAATWLLLTLTLAGAVTRSSQALRPYVSPQLPDGLLLLIALILGALLGIASPGAKVLVVLTLGMCLIAVTLFGGVIYSPVWRGTLPYSVTLSNHAQQHALLMFIWTLIPAGLGALFGYVAGQALQGRAPTDCGERVSKHE